MIGIIDLIFAVFAFFGAALYFIVLTIFAIVLSCLPYYSYYLKNRYFPSNDDTQKVRIYSILKYSGWLLFVAIEIFVLAGTNYVFEDNRYMHRDVLKQAKEKRDKSLTEWKYWSDLDNDCLNTKHETLRIYSFIKEEYSDDGCRVISGKWLDPFTHETITNPELLEVVHVVPISWASAHGARQWDVNKKEKFANDTENLLVVSKIMAQRKIAIDPLRWLPPRKEYHCDYFRKWLYIVKKYSLNIRNIQPFNTRLNEVCGEA